MQAVPCQTLPSSSSTLIFIGFSFAANAPLPSQMALRSGQDFAALCGKWGEGCPRPTFRQGCYL